jgi:hypothetical protein
MLYQHGDFPGLTPPEMATHIIISNCLASRGTRINATPAVAGLSSGSGRLGPDRRCVHSAAME